jgi:uncharacterized protein YjbI with pentapeptide repeats
MAEDGKSESRPDAAPLPPIAGKANDLEALRNAVVDAANVSGALWFSYLFVLIYLVVAVGSVTHRNLFFESPVKLPFLNVDLPLLGFFTLGPAIFLVVHAYVLLHFAMLADKVGAFHAELSAQIADDGIRTRLRRQLPSNIFVQFLAGPRELREGFTGLMLRLIAQISLVVGPLALLVLFQIQFLPYHHEAITWWHRLAIVADLVLLWILWPSVSRGETTSIRWGDFRDAKVAATGIASCIPVLFVFMVATFPGEWLHKSPLSVPLVPQIKGNSVSLITPHEFLFDGQVDLVDRKLRSLWANRMVLPNLDALPPNFSARGRHLQGAVLLGAILPKIDFTAAEMQDAAFNDADLREAKFACAESQVRLVSGNTAAKPDKRCSQLQRASFNDAKLDGATFAGAQLQDALFHDAKLQNVAFDDAKLHRARFVRAKLRGATFERAELHNVSLDSADLPGVSLFKQSLDRVSMTGANLRGAILTSASLRGAQLDNARLQGAVLQAALLDGASLDDAHLQGAILDRAQFRGGSLTRAKLQGASIRNAFLEGNYLNGADLRGASLRATRLVAASLVNVDLQGASIEHAELRDAKIAGAFIWRLDARYAKAQGTRIVEPQAAQGYTSNEDSDCRGTACEWTTERFADFKRMIETEVPEGDRRRQALERIASLDPDMPPPDDGRAGAWAELESKAAAIAASDERLIDEFHLLGCRVGEPPYVMQGLLPQLEVRFDKGSPVAAAIAAKFLREDCNTTPKLLSRAQVDWLRQIRDRPPPTPPVPAGDVPKRNQPTN